MANVYHGGVWRKAVVEQRYVIGVLVRFRDGTTAVVMPWHIHA
jgi:hypothetical protein